MTAPFYETKSVLVTPVLGGHSMRCGDPMYPRGRRRDLRCGKKDKTMQAASVRLSVADDSHLFTLFHSPQAWRAGAFMLSSVRPQRRPLQGGGVARRCLRSGSVIRPVRAAHPMAVA